MNLFFAQLTGGAGLMAAAAFFVIFAVIAFIAYKMLKRTVKMAFRIAIVLVILAVAAAGSIALWAVSGSSSDRARPSRSR